LKNIIKKSGKIQFPDPASLAPDSEGLIYVGGDLSVSNLLSAYQAGIYPWPLEASYPIFWFCPEPRGVLFFSDLHIPRSLQKALKRAGFRLTMNQAFDRVIEACAQQVRDGQEGTWIIPQMISAYKDFHRAGHAYSVECWLGDELVGGLYGVYVDGVFSGESMYHSATNASKACLLYLVDVLKTNGLEWMDIQMLTPVTEQLGGKYVNRPDFLKLLKARQAAHHPDRLDIGYDSEPTRAD
jgi:leucyl/phenylalanyl-tRNA---protein transferase